MRIDHAAFARDIKALRKELEADLGAEDLAHFRKLARWQRAASIAGWATSWMAPNPVSAALIAVGTTTRWAVVAHHISHRGMDRVPGGPRSSTFAKGNRRWVDWLDWMHPDAWAHEHNTVHHFRTGEVADPDLVEHNMRTIRDADMPRLAKLAVVGFYACTWRLTYYAPNTWDVLRKEQRDKQARRGEPVSGEGESMLDPRTGEGRAFLLTLLPYAFTRFVAAPLAALPLGPVASANVLCNALAAEVLTNLYTFVLIAPNHAGDDVYRFDEPQQDKADFYIRQVVGSVNYNGGTDVSDFLHGYLNYQIEHHLWPDLPPLKYRQAQPKVQAICEKHGVPYVRESVFKRVRKLVSIMVGDRSMPRSADAREIVRSAAGQPGGGQSGHLEGAAVEQLAEGA